jgi:hypothetical protein
MTDEEIYTDIESVPTDPPPDGDGDDSVLASSQPQSGEDGG